MRSNNFNKFAEESFVDLYDEDVAKIGKALNTALEKFKGRTDNYSNLSELAKYLEDEIHGIGYVAYLDISPIIFGEPPVLEILGPVDQTETDHERKQWEVHKAKVRKEKYYGERGKQA